MVRPSSSADSANKLDLDAPAHILAKVLASVVGLFVASLDGATECVMQRVSLTIIRKSERWHHS
jgi:hypothetical protein